MAFSYSDENFTVVGNLCFVHIKSTTSGSKSFRIPPALADRMLIDDYLVLATSYNFDTGSEPIYVEVSDKKIKFSTKGDISYINFFFPINSNK